jgi:hypothetical protein
MLRDRTITHRRIEGLTPMYFFQEIKKRTLRDELFLLRMRGKTRTRVRLQMRRTAILGTILSVIATGSVIVNR